jgi:hypothetical protein
VKSGDGSLRHFSRPDPGQGGPNAPARRVLAEEDERIDDFDRHRRRGQNSVPRLRLRQVDIDVGGEVAGLEPEDDIALLDQVT